MTHSFDDKLTQGETIEALLDEYFEGDYEITHATPAEQRMGIDRFFTRRNLGFRTAAHYKADFRAAQTGNAFIETISVDTRAKAGWVIASRAAWILNYLPQTRILYLLRTQDLRRLLPQWQAAYPTRSAKNDGYSTHGLLVPLAELERVAEAVVEAP
jgi:hypothetical protein